MLTGVFKNVSNIICLSSLNDTTGGNNEYNLARSQNKKF